MADLIIKPNSSTGNKLILQDQAGNAVLTTGDSVGAAIPTISGNLTVAGTLTVEGATTTIESVTLTVDDKNLMS